MGRRQVEKINTCGHPEVKHAAKGMCHTCYYRERYRRNPERGRAEAAKYRRANSDKVQARTLAWRKKNPEKYRAIQKRMRWRAMGIDPDAAAALHASHDGRCACCGSSDPRSKRGWHTDHSHITGKVRGILCSPCNVALGQLEPYAIKAENLDRYLARHQ